jgi:hypothetical protein
MIRVNIEDGLELTITENDRGQWEVISVDPKVGSWTLVGYGGENILTIHASFMQSGRQDVVVVHNVVDSPIVIAQGETQDSDYSLTEFNSTVNALISDLTDYPDSFGV